MFFFLFFFLKYNITNIRILDVFIGPLQQFFLINSCFSNSSINAKQKKQKTKKKNWGVPHLLHVCVFFLSKYWSVKHFFSCSQLQESSFVFKVSLKGLLPPKIIFSVATSELAIKRSYVTICFNILRLHRQVFF